MRSITIRVSLLTLLLLFVGCGGPRNPDVSYRMAAHWFMPMTVKVLKSWDMVYHHADVEPSVTHLVEVEVIEPPRTQKGFETPTVGQKLMLPYDDFRVGVEPPGKGAIVTIAPAQWVNASRSSKGTPQKKWMR